VTGERIRDGGALESTAGYAMQQHHDRLTPATSGGELESEGAWQPF